MCFGDRPGATAGLDIGQPGAKFVRSTVDDNQGAAGDFHPHDPAKQGIELVDVPVSVHVRFAKPQRPAQRATEKPLIIDSDVPGIAAVDPDPGLAENIGDDLARHSAHTKFLPCFSGHAPGVSVCVFAGGVQPSSTP